MPRQKKWALPLMALLLLLPVGCRFPAFLPVKADQSGLVNFIRTVTRVVPDQYPTIQSAINNANDGDTIFVESGTYFEHIVVNRTVSLVGEDSQTTIVDANGTGRGLSIVRGYVNITGFTVRKSGSAYGQDAGIWIEGAGH